MITDINHFITYLNTNYNFDIISMNPLNGGRNNQVYRLKSKKYLDLIVKLFFRDSADSRDRFAVEIAAYQFLLKNNVKAIPQLIASEKDLAFALFEWIEGVTNYKIDLTSSDIYYAADFLIHLYELSKIPEAKKIINASETFFSIKSVIENVQLRLNRMHTIILKLRYYENIISCKR